MGPCIIMLQHEVMVGDELHNNGPQDLVTVSQNAINKMHLNKLECRGKVHFSNSTQIVKLVYQINSMHTD